MAVTSGTTYRFTNAQFPVKALNVYASGTTISARRNVCLYDNDPNDIMQDWLVIGSESGGYTFKCVANNSYVLRYSDGTNSASCAENADVELLSNTETADILVDFVYLGNNRVKIKHRYTDKYLTAYSNANGDSNSITDVETTGNVYWSANSSLGNKQVWNISPSIDDEEGTPTTNSLTTNIVANTAYTFQNAYSNKMLNLYAGYTTDSTNVCTYYFDASTEQKWTPKSSGSYLKLYTESGSGKCLHKASTGNAEIYSDSSSQNSNQQIIIEKYPNQGYVKIKLANSPTMYLTASYDAANGKNTTAYKAPGAAGNVFWATATDTNVKSDMQQRWYARLASRANDDVVTCRQSKSNWCWATVAREMIRYKNGSLKDIPYCTDGMRDQGGRNSVEAYPSINGVNMVDNATAQLVKFIKTDADNHEGNAHNIVAILHEYTNASANIFAGDLTSNSNITTYVDAKLANGPIVLNAFTGPGVAGTGHSVLILNKNDNGTYHVWDPWDADFDDMTASQLFKGGGFSSPAVVEGAIHGQTIVYFNN